MLPAHLNKSIDFLLSRIAERPSVALVLGSGLGQFADNIADAIHIPSTEIPNYPQSTVEGHKGHLVFGRVAERPVLLFQGRVHFYESRNLDGVLYPIRIAHALGVSTLVVTNAAGGINRSFLPGDLMLITDHINLNTQPYAWSVWNGHRSPYDGRLLQAARSAASGNSIGLREGIYVGVKGPSYETAAEVEAIRRLGGDAVGMSTVFEASLASSLGIRVLGISCITNLATGISKDKLSHAEVTEVGALARDKFSQLIRSILVLL